MEETAKGRPVVHFEVLGEDGPALRRYYSELFDWTITEAGGPMDYGLVEGGEHPDPGVSAIGGGIGGGQGQGGHVTFYVDVADIEATLAKAESLGGKRLHGPDSVPGQGISIAHFSDPEGHVIGLVSASS